MRERSGGRTVTTDSSAELVELTDEQKDIIRTVRDFVDTEVIPVANELEHRDEFPEKIVEQMKEMGLFGLTAPEEYGGGRLCAITFAPRGCELRPAGFNFLRHYGIPFLL